MPRRRALPLAALLAGVALLASACSLAGRHGQEHEDRAAPPAHAHRAPRKPGPTVATGTPVRVVMNDRFRYRPSSIIVRAGRRVTFTVTNVGKLPHEFILGDRATQLDHERQMQAMPAGGEHLHAHTHGPDDHAMADTDGAGRRPGASRSIAATGLRLGRLGRSAADAVRWARGRRGGRAGRKGVYRFRQDHAVHAGGGA
jgi:plastocyanin